MKKATILATLVFAAGASIAEEASISDVSWRQLWPWSGDVEISFTVSGANTPVTFVAQYDGVEPFTLSEHDLSGDFFDAAPGRRRVRWSPARAGLDAKALENFRIISATPETSGGNRTYLVLNMVDGSYTFRDSPPEGGWVNHDAAEDGKKYINLVTNMVFRRIPAGVAKLGMPDDLRTRVGYDISKSSHRYSQRHDVTISSDFYLGVFPVTKAQWRFATNYYVYGTKPNIGHVDRARHEATYNTIRGATNAPYGIDWPNTRFSVATNSIVEAFRNLVKDTFSPDWSLDLPTAAQWEYAARADTPIDQIWSVGGLATDTDEAFTNCLNQIATWKGNTPTTNANVGRHAPNGWGLYDMIGLCCEWNLDWCTDSSPLSGTDPVGPVSGNGRVRRSYTASTPTYWYYLTPSFLYSIDPNGSSDYGYRLCIHLKSPFAK